MQNRLVPALVAVIVVLTATLAFTIGRQTASTPEPRSAPTPAATPKPALPMAISSIATIAPTLSSTPEPTSSPKSVFANAGELVPTKGAKPFTETFDDVSIKFLPTKDFRKMIEYRIAPTVDTSCTPSYTAREQVRKIDYAWDFVIKSFETWNDKEGKQEYMIEEEDALPNAYQGSLHDIVREGRTVTIAKQRCGMGQVEGLVAVRP